MFIRLSYFTQRSATGRTHGRMDARTHARTHGCPIGLVPVFLVCWAALSPPSISETRLESLSVFSVASSCLFKFVTFLFYALSTLSR